MVFHYQRDGWNVETTHDIEIDQPCADGIDPAIAFATDWGSSAFQAQTVDNEGIWHTIVVRQITE